MNKSPSKGLFSTLAGKVFLATYAGILLTVVVTGVAAFLFMRSVLQRAIMDNQLEVAHQTLNRIDRLLYERYLDIQVIADEYSFENFLDNLKKNSDEAMAVEKSLLKKLKALTLLTGPWDTLCVVEQGRRIVLTTRQAEAGTLINENTYPKWNAAFEAAMKGSVYYSDAVLLEYGGYPSVVFAAPIRDIQDHEIVGAVLGTFSWPVVLEILGEIPIPAVLLNNKGDVIGDNRASTSSGFSFDRSRYSNFSHYVNKHESRSIIMPRGRGILPEEALTSIAAQSGYLSYEGSGWSLVLSNPTRIVFSPANESAAGLVLLLTLLILPLGFVILFIISRSVVRPLASLTQTTREITGGNLKKQALVASNDEIGQLAAAFNAMTQRLGESYETLEKKVAERTLALHESEKKSRAVIETANDAFVGMDGRGFITDWNQKAETMFGWKRGEVIGRVLADTIIPPSFRHLHREGLRRFLETGQGKVLNKRLELSAIRRDGTEFPVEATIWVIGTGKDFNFNAFIQDISDRKRLEQVALQSEKMSAVGQLASGVAHEINNPLGVILGFAQGMVKRVQPGDPIEMPLKSIEREAVRCKQLVQDLLTFSRAGKTEKEEIDLNEAIEGALTLVLAQSKVKNSTLLKEFFPDLPKILANRNNLQQVVINLCNNAFDAMPAGGQVIVRTQKARLNGYDAVEICVQDTGCGISKENLPRIFEPFFTTKEVGKGTGLGLSLVFEIVQKHEGNIAVESEPGKGTLFRVSLPIKRPLGATTGEK